MGSDLSDEPGLDPFVHALFEDLQQGVLFQDNLGHILVANTAAKALLGTALERLSGFGADDSVAGLTTADGHPFPAARYPVALALDSGRTFSDVIGVHGIDDDSTLWIRLTATPHRNASDGTSFVISVIEDVSLHLQSETLQRQWIDAFQHTSHGIAVGLPTSNRILTCNPAFAALQGRTVEELMSMPILSMYAPEDHETVRAHIAEADKLGSTRYDARMIRKDGSRYPVQMDLVSVRDGAGTLLYRIATQQDITERKRSETRIDQLYRLYATLSQINQTIVRTDTQAALFSAVCRLAIEYGKFQLAWIGLHDPDTGLVSIVAESQPLGCAPITMGVQPHQDGLIDAALSGGRTVHANDERAEHLRCWGDRDPKIAFRSCAVVPIRRAGTTIGVLTLYAEDASFFTFPEEQQLLDEMGLDISFALDMLEREAQRQQAQAALAESAAALKKSQAVAHVGHWSWEPHVNRLHWSDEMYNIFGIDPRSTELDLNEVIAQAIHPDDRALVDRANAAVIERQAPAPLEYRVLRPDGTTRTVWAKPDVAETDANGSIVRLTGIVQDVTERVQAQERLQRQLDRLSALRAIDRMISTNFDIRSTLTMLLNQVVANLNVDGAAVLLYDEHLQLLEYAAGRGFRSRAIEHTQLRLGQGCAGRVALERRTLLSVDIDAPVSPFTRFELLANEGFVAYGGAPLVAKGRLVGVLEVFQRSVIYADTDWLTYFETLAGQAAIAIDDARLFNEIQRSNTELRLAYDATIEGWSRAMDLRDKETEGHTQRVTQLTVALAQAAGMSADEIAHVRRGALLHDIGKLGVPDRILLKEEALTDDEWVVMRRHPQYAYEMLSSIEYLRPALDIPHCHHEKWDGTGYPRGLKGEQIPLAARIFMIVDVWDALRSDRPYRASWPEPDVFDFIRRGSGTHFDPKAVALFFQHMRDRQREP